MYIFLNSKLSHNIINSETINSPTIVLLESNLNHNYITQYQILNLDMYYLGNLLKCN